MEKYSREYYLERFKADSDDELLGRHANPDLSVPARQAVSELLRQRDVEVPILEDRSIGKYGCALPLEPKPGEPSPAPSSHLKMQEVSSRTTLIIFALGVGLLAFFGVMSIEMGLALLGMAAAFQKLENFDYREGQKWSYRTRRLERKSTVAIRKIEQHGEFGKVFHVSVTHVIDSEVIYHPHFAVAETTMFESLKKCLGKCDPDSEFATLHQRWKVALDQGGAGVLSGSLSEIVDFAEGIASRRQG